VKGEPTRERRLQMLRDLTQGDGNGCAYCTQASSRRKEKHKYPFSYHFIYFLNRDITKQQIVSNFFKCNNIYHISIGYNSISKVKTKASKTHSETQNNLITT